MVSSRADSMKLAVKEIIEGLNSRNLDAFDKYIAQDMITHKSTLTRVGELQRNWLNDVKETILRTAAKNNDGKLIAEDIRVDGDICIVRVYRAPIKYFNPEGVEQTRGGMVEHISARWESGKFVEYWQPILNLFD